MAEAFIFCGPTLPLSAMQDRFGLAATNGSFTLENGSKITFLPPVAEGDVLERVALKPAIIGIIDGYFEKVPSVWHKEILYAMTQGIHVLGASSMGALRAAELSAFGMEGVGEIYDAFARNLLTDDDEVAVVHGPAELGYPSLSEAMVNIRQTLNAAIEADIVSREEGALLIRIAKGFFYKHRTYKNMLESAFRYGINEQRLATLEKWIAVNRLDQKQADALELVKIIIERLNRQLEKKQVLYHFEETILWKNARNITGHKDSDAS
jgi:hypothetical protein